MGIPRDLPEEGGGTCVYHPQVLMLFWAHWHCPGNVISQWNFQVSFQALCWNPWEQRSQARLVTGLDFCLSWNAYTGLLSSEGLKGLVLWLLYHCQIRCEFSFVTLSRNENPHSGMQCHIKQRTEWRTVPHVILPLVFRGEESLDL